MIILYYSIFVAILIFGSDIFLASEGYSSTIDLNDSALSDPEIEQGGFFTVGVSFTRFLGLVAFGVGLGDDTPSSFKLMFALWQTIITILSVMWFISAIWNG